MNFFTKTWTQDFKWIELAIYSVLNHCQENVNWYIAVERLNRSELDDVVSRAAAHFKDKRSGDSFQTFDSEIVWPESQNIVAGYMRQQWIKMNVHRLVGDHLIWNWDSDVIALRTFNSSYFMKNERPIWWWDDMNFLITGGYPSSRKDFLMNMFGGDVGREYMRCMPIPLLGSALSEGSKTDIWAKALSACAGNNANMTEFNVLGEYCYRHHQNSFTWLNAHNDGPTHQGEANDPTKITYQAWSWGGTNQGLIDLVMKR